MSLPLAQLSPRVPTTNELIHRSGQQIVRSLSVVSTATWWLPRRPLVPALYLCDTRLWLPLVGAGHVSFPAAIGSGTMTLRHTTVATIGEIRSRVFFPAAIGSGTNWTRQTGRCVLNCWPDAAIVRRVLIPAGVGVWMYLRTTGAFRDLLYSRKNVMWNWLIFIIIVFQCSLYLQVDIKEPEITLKSWSRSNQ